MYCSSCGSVINKSADFCSSCGVKIGSAPVLAVDTEEFSEKSRVVAGVLGIVLGGIGVHRFYLGSVGIGILQIILTIITFGIAGIWGFIEGVIILAGGKWRDSSGKALRPHGQ
ncbi:MAG: TM2 domain-containing protein [SAR202 cluster bacterium]|nr:hypothetical protein [Chloroflexota bacterium]MQG88058.1 TM2 domain-containing protein [SAR202 cluster bacterium]